MAGLAVELPLTRNNSDGFALIQNYNDLVTQNLKMLILTCPGERLMDPEFGVGARHYLFENMTPATFDSFKSRLLTQQAKYLPYLTIESVDFQTSESNRALGDNVLGIRIQYFNKSLNVRRALTLPVSF
jgi:phage baseplate assembly protein W